MAGPGFSPAHHFPDFTSDRIRLMKVKSFSAESFDVVRLFLDHADILIENHRRKGRIDQPDDRRYWIKSKGHVGVDSRPVLVYWSALAHHDKVPFFREIVIHSSSRGHEKGIRVLCLASSRDQ